jgi:DNA-binding beta-propeller fold protein YncE
MSQNFGKYKIICEVGRGGMGIIYKAQDSVLNRVVAIKQLILENVDPDKRDEFRERFRREASLAAGLTHPNLISIYDVSISPDNNYYVMEFLDGYSLRIIIERSPGQKLSADEFLPIFKQTCAGLGHAHDMTLVHRDIKPDNIFILPDGKVKITDFGIARSREGDNSNLTKPGVMLGTLSYVSPEQLQDARNVDHRADIYSLGVVAYESLVGQVPFAGDGLTSTLMAIISKEAKPANDVNPEISADVASVIAKAMRKRSSERYQSLAEFEKEFDRAVNMARGSAAAAGMLRSGLTGGGPATSYTPGIPMAPSGRLTPATGIRVPASIQPAGALPTAGAPAGNLPAANGQTAPAGEEAPKVVKPWLSGRTSEQMKPVAGKANPITQSVALVKVIGQMGRPGEGPGSLQEPGAVCARQGKIVVADTASRRFQVFSRDGRVQGQSRPNPSLKAPSKTSGGIFSKPSSVAIDTRGRIFASDSSDHYIRVFDGQGMFAREFLNKHGKDGGILGLYSDNACNIYMCDPDNGCVHLYSDAGNWLRKVGTKGSADGQLQLPQSVAQDRFGTLYVVDYGTSKVSVFNKAGFFQKSWGGKGTGKGQFNVPRGIAVDKQDRIYVCDSLNHRLQVFSANGDYLYSFGGRGTEPGRFIGPSDVSIDPGNNILYVVDKGNCRVQFFELL